MIACVTLGFFSGVAKQNTQNTKAARVAEQKSQAVAQSSAAEQNRVAQASASKSKPVPFPVLLNAIQIGMSGDQIIATVGRPDSVERSRAVMGGSTWFYFKLVLHDITQKPEMVKLYFDTSGRLNTIIYDGRFWDRGDTGVREIPGGYKSSEDIKQVTQGMQDLLRQMNGGK